MGTNWSEYYLMVNNGTDSGQKTANTISGLVDSHGKWINTKWKCSGGIACRAQEQSDEDLFDPASCSIPVMRDNGTIALFIFIPIVFLTKEPQFSFQC